MGLLSLRKTDSLSLFVKLKMEKLHLSYPDVHRLVSKISDEILNSAIIPEVAIAISAGGLIPARLFRNCLNLPIYVVCIKFYDEEEDIPEGSKPIIKQWLDENALKFVRGKRVLIVDEVSDSGSTIRCCIDKLRETCDPESISVAVLNDKDKTGKQPVDDDVTYYVGEETDDVWICYPWESIDIANDDDSDTDEDEHTSYVAGPESLSNPHCNLF